MHKNYGPRPALRDVSLDVPPGQFVLIVGPNASGKTTLLRLLSTTARPSTGRVRWGRDEEHDLPKEEVRERIGYVGHVPLVYDELTVRENVEFHLRIRGAPRERARRDGEHWLNAFGLLARADERAAALSRGLRQRLALAQAFAPQPKYLLLDEPSSNLDASGSDALVRALREQKGRSLIVVAAHQAGPFRALADRVLELRAGRLVESGGAP